MNKQKYLTIQLLAWLIALHLALVPVCLAQQAKKPITRNGLLEAVKLNGLSTQELIQRIEQRGVSFQLSSTDEAEFRAAGARPELLAAVRTNYHASVPAKENNPTVKPAATMNVPPGAPLGKSEIVVLLQSGVPASRVEQFVIVRHVNFSLNPLLSREITTAGGTPALLKAIQSSARSANFIAENKLNEASGTNAKTGAKPIHHKGLDYDDLTDQATSALRSNNYPVAMQYLQQAITLDAKPPTAYAMLGFAQLYGMQNPGLAEQSMRAAIERGGGAVLRVYHDHDGFFNGFCAGSFFITKTGVTFKADDGQHTFEAKKADLTEGQLNGYVGKHHNAFHLKVQSDKRKNTTYNFAPLTHNQMESLLVLALIKSY